MKWRNAVFALSSIAVVLMVGFLTRTFLSKQACVKKFSETGIAQELENSVRNQSLGIDKPLKSEVVQKMNKLQMPFIANEGQIEEQVGFYAKTFSGTMFVTNNGEIVYTLPGKSSGDVSSESGVLSLEDRNCDQLKVDSKQPGHTLANKTERLLCGISLLKRGDQGVCNTTPIHPDKSETHPKPFLPEVRTRFALKEELVGAQVETVQGEQSSITKVNYFKGNDPSLWKPNISTYDVVTLAEVYEGIHLKLKAYGSNVEKLFYVKPGADPEQILVKLNGVSGLCVNDEGQLVAETELGPVKFTKPIAYQENDGKRVEVGVEYRIQKSEARGQNTDHLTDNSKLEKQTSELIYGFKIAAYDRTKELIIDPLLASTFLGGSGSDRITSIALDQGGNVYVAGHTQSLDFPNTVGAYDTSFNGNYDVFISKLDGNLTQLFASTYLGGSSYDVAQDVTIGSDGNVYVTGYIYTEDYESDFPVTNGAYDESYNGGSYDSFISKLNGELTDLLASTYLGGGNDEHPYSIAIDTSGNVYIGGTTMSRDFPITIDAYDISFNGYYTEAFVSKLSEDLTSLLASTYLGGSSGDNGYFLAIDSSGNIYVGGHTSSSDFPTTSGAYDTIYNYTEDDRSDVFVSKLNGDLTTLLASTYLGGFGNDSPFCVALDSDRNVYLAGYTYSSNFPTTAGAYDTSRNGNSDSADIFVSKLNGDLTTLLASTYLGGSFDEHSTDIAIDTNENVYIAGNTMSWDFPITLGAYSTCHNFNDFNAFVSKLSGDLTSLIASTFFGATVISIAIESGGNVYLAGEVASPDFPTISDAYDTSYNGGSDAFLSKLDSNLSVSCQADSIEASPKTLKLKIKESGTATLTVLCSDGSPVICETVMATIKSGKKRISVTPLSQDTDVNGEAIFTITATTKTGKAKVEFEATGLKTTVTVKVKK
ncbi:conserved hypothetical protein [Candidatus Brocadia pituitae]|nr:conserved hypothetical protein [Candidatus Brocadia pituitae]